MNKALELAVFQQGPGDFVVGLGPFEERAEPPAGRAAFYRNDFWLGDPRPWKVPSRLIRSRTLPSFNSSLPTIHWQSPDSGSYENVFQGAKNALAAGILHKAVPVTTRKGQLLDGHPRDFLARLGELSPALSAYGWLGKEGGFLGATPERLFRYQSGRVESMALAGTAPRGKERSLLVDRKEQREHALVVDALRERLSRFGDVAIGRPDILNLGSLSHLHTPVIAHLHRAHPSVLCDLIAALHPTPALGVSPRTPVTTRIFRQWRERLDCPSSFGAPFGFWDQGRLDMLVAIRMLSFKGTDVSLPTGAGLLSESRLHREWKELELKARAVLELFGLGWADRESPVRPPFQMPPRQDAMAWAERQNL